MTNKTMRTLFNDVENVPVIDLKPHPKNPRVGNVDVIAESLETYGQYRPIIVNSRNNTIVAGHHTWLAAKKLEWPDVSVAWVDIDEPTHVKIMLMDNKSSDAGEYDDSVLAELLASLPTIEGTGYTDIEVGDILKDFDVDQIVRDVNAVVAGEETITDQWQQSQTFDGTPMGEEPDLRQQETPIMPEDKQAELPPRTIEDQGEQVGATYFAPPRHFEFEGDNKWGIPELVPDKLMTFDEIPDNIEAWAGSATRDNPDPEQWWFYNWGIDSTSGMKDISKVVVAFYAWDDYFENWWAYPDRYAGKLVNSGVKYLVTPDFSMEYNMSPCEWLWQLYRSRFIGRYMQECGIKVVPNVSWVAGIKNTFLEDHVLPTLDVGLPLICIQMQTIGEQTKANPDAYLREIQTVFDTLRPQGAIIYASKAGRELFPRINTHGAPVKIIANRLEKLSAQQNKRKKKMTI